MSTRRRGSLVEEAQYWEKLLEKGGDAEKAAFAAWIKRSPQNLQAYLLHSAIEAELRGLDASGDFDIDTLLAKASTNVVELSSGMPQRTAASPPTLEWRKKWRLWGAIAAGAVLAAFMIVAGMLSSPRWTDYSTGTGELRRVVLADGSSIELNTQSHIRVSLRPNAREVDLLRGEALFNVQHDATRPFRVHAGDRVIEDLGTQFSIYLRPDASTTISVLDGRVQILPAASAPDRSTAAVDEASHRDRQPEPILKLTQLSAGEEIHIAPGGKLLKRAAIKVEEVAPWREHRLWFEGASLPEVAAEFNRYNKRQMRVSDDAVLSKKRYTATFDAYDPDSFVQALLDDPALSVQSSDTGILIQAR